MRDLAAEARVSVPTLYNLFGSKDHILVAELQAMAGSIAAAVPSGNLSFFQRGMASFNAGMRIIEAAPEFYRAMAHIMVTSRATDEMRQRVEQAFVAILKAPLDMARKAGQLADWAEPELVGRHIWGIQTTVFLAWGLGQMDFQAFKFAAYSGTCHILAGAARGAFLAEVEAELAKLRNQYLVAMAQQKEAKHAVS